LVLRRPGNQLFQRSDDVWRQELRPGVVPAVNEPVTDRLRSGQVGSGERIRDRRQRISLNATLVAPPVHSTTS
jgi:hypothetical protein